MNVPHEAESMLVSAIQYWTRNTYLFNSIKDDAGVKQLGVPTVYRGFLPINMAGQINPAIPQFFPHVIVQVSEAKYTFEEATMMVKLMVGCWDDNEDFSGYQGVIQIMDILVERLYNERIIGEHFPLTGALNWKLVQGSDLWPMFFGILDMEMEAFLPGSRFDGMINDSLLNDTRIYFVRPKVLAISGSNGQLVIR